MKYKLKKDIIGAKAGTEFEYRTGDGFEGIELINGKSIGNTLDLIKAIGIDNTDYFKKVGECNFSEFIGRHGNALAIKGDKLLISYENGDLFYSNDEKDLFRDKLNYTETTLDKLEVGDVFIFKDNIKEMELYNFNIYIGTDNDGDDVIRCLDNTYGIERIKHTFLPNSNTYGIERIKHTFLPNSNTKVIKFLRD